LCSLVCGSVRVCVYIQREQEREKEGERERELFIGILSRICSWSLPVPIVYVRVSSMRGNLPMYSGESC
jgi:hypothetical protein